ncbi:MAG: ATP-binding protein [Spirochaetales bacterium]
MIRPKHPSILYLTLLSVWVLLLPGCAGTPRKESIQIPQAERGFLDLSAIDLSVAGPVPLKGQWEFYWDTWIDPVQASTSSPQNREFVPVPANWKTYSQVSPPFSLQGKATYRLRVLTDGKVHLYGLRLKRIYSAYRLFVNGMLVASNGTLKDSLEETEGQLAVRTVYFTSFTPTLDIVLHVANPYYYRAGIMAPPQLGTQASIERIHVLSLASDVFLLGVIAIMAAYYYILSFMLVKHRFSSLFFALFCTVVGLRILLISGERFLYYLVPGLGLRTDMVLQGFGIYPLIPTFLTFLYFLFPGNGKTRWIKFVGVASSLYLLAALILPVQFHGYILTAYYPFFIFGLGYMAHIIGHAMLKRESDAFLEGFGFLFILFTATHDMLVDREVLLGDYLLPLGLLGFIFIQSMILSRRFSRAFIRMEVLVQENKRILDALESRVEERTADLRRMNEHLEEARRTAEEASQAKTRFLQNMSHEMRTPLNGVLGYAELIRDTDPKSIHRTYAEKIIEESKNLLDLINQILDLSKIEAGKLTLEQRTFDLEELIRSVYDILHPLAEKKQIPFRVSMAPALPPNLKGDPVRLRQILVNLVGNAIKFTHEGWVELKVEQQETEKDRVILLFTIQDTGIGISKDFQSAIFESFTQAQAGLSKAYGGTGLGTTIAKQLTELMGGSISFSSEEGKGTIFWVSIPFQEASAEQLHPPGSPVLEENLPDLQGKTILIVEDYPTTLQITRHHLESAGATVHIAENGLEGIKELGKHPVDCILMDVQMPRMDGLETTRWIRKLPNGEDIPILGMTASAYNEDIQTCLDAGMNDVLTKPLRKKDLLEKIHFWTRNTRTGPASEQPGYGPTKAAPASDSTNTSRVESAPSESVPFDLLKLQEELQGDAEELMVLLRGFLLQLDTSLEKIEVALQNGDLTLLAREAHSLKGGALTLYAHPLARSAEMLERLARTGSPLPQIRRAWGGVQQAVQVLTDAILSRLEEPG